MRRSRWVKGRDLLAVEPHTNQDLTDVVHVLTTTDLRAPTSRAPVESEGGKAGNA